jgi:hypothetical protein
LSPFPTLFSELPPHQSDSLFHRVVGNNLAYLLHYGYDHIADISPPRLAAAN